MLSSSPLHLNAQVKEISAATADQHENNAPPPHNNSSSAHTTGRTTAVQLTAISPLLTSLLHTHPTIDNERRNESLQQHFNLSTCHLLTHILSLCIAIVVLLILSTRHDGRFERESFDCVDVGHSYHGRRIQVRLLLVNKAHHPYDNRPPTQLPSLIPPPPHSLSPHSPASQSTPSFRVSAVLLPCSGLRCTIRSKCSHATTTPSTWCHSPAPPPSTSTAYVLPNN